MQNGTTTKNQHSNFSGKVSLLGLGSAFLLSSSSVWNTQYLSRCRYQSGKFPARKGEKLSIFVFMGFFVFLYSTQIVCECPPLVKVTFVNIQKLFFNPKNWPKCLILTPKVSLGIFSCGNFSVYAFPGRLKCARQSSRV